MCFPCPSYLVLGQITTKVFHSVCALLCRSHVCSTLNRRNQHKGTKIRQMRTWGLLAWERKGLKKEVIYTPQAHRGQNWDQRGDGKNKIEFIIYESQLPNSCWQRTLASGQERKRWPFGEMWCRTADG